MIDPKSLRIGNLIFAEVLFKTVRTVTHIDQDHIGLLIKGTNFTESVNRFSLEMLHPIPLDESWLMRCSLLRKTDLYNDAKNLENVVGKYKGCDYYEYVIESSPCDMGGYNYITRRVDFVHQLQNLVFCLTGEELSFAEVGADSSQPPAAGLALDGNS